MMTAFEVVGRRSLWAGLGALALLTACSTAPPHYKTALTGEKEVPPVSTPAAGLSDISVRPGRCPSAGSSSDCIMLVGTVQTTGVVGTAAHVHEGAVGQNGPVIVTLVKTGTDVWSVPLGTTLTDAQYKAYLDGRLYVNVHSDANKGGEVRAQLRP
jgi:hypothetical protein